jgi:hypothetical protein
MKPVNPYPVIYQLLNRGVWYAPHEVHLQLKLVGCHISADSTSSRMRDLRKPKYGRHKLVKRPRNGTKYFEYSIITEQQQAA